MRVVADSVRVSVLAAVAVAFAGLAATARAQWTGTSLHPAGATESVAYGTTGSQQAGYATFGGVSRAGTWNGSPATWAGISSAEATGATAYCIEGGQPAGKEAVSSVDRATIWNGAIVAKVDLHPLASTSSRVYSSAGGLQVGVATVDGISQASLWRGSALSWVNLNPVGAAYSEAYAVAGNLQGGVAFVDGFERASLWSGTSESWVDLTPAGASDSRVYGIFDGQQVGWVTVGGVAHAAFWRGAAATWIDLNPTSALDSQANAIADGWQVGHAHIDGVQRACIWSGAAASWTDLSTFLSGSWGSTSATGLSTEGGILRVSGYGFNAETGRVEALLWTRACISLDIQPATAVACPGASTTLSVSAPGATSFQWQVEVPTLPATWVDLFDHGGTSAVSGSHTATLTISNLTRSASSQYRVKVTTPACAGEVTSTSATLYVGGPQCGCVADVDDGTMTGTLDGGVTIDDLLYFLQRFEAGC